MGGAPGSHKTNAALMLAVDMALAGQRVLFVTLELALGEIGARVLSRFSGVDGERLDRAFGPERLELTEQENEALAAAEARIDALAMHLRFHGAEDGGSRLDDVIRSATRLHFDAVFVDHLGMVDRGHGDELAAIPRAAENLRLLCRGRIRKGYRPFVCVTTPLSRKRDEDDHPKLSHLRGSGNLEYDGDGVMVLQKRERKGDTEGPDEVDGFVLKQRQGRCPIVLTFEADGATSTVREKPPQGYAPPVPWQDGEEER